MIEYMCECRNCGEGTTNRQFCCDSCEKAYKDKDLIAVPYMEVHPTIVLGEDK